MLWQVVFQVHLMVLHCKGVMNDKSAEIPDLCPEVEEADAHIIPHAMHAASSGI